MYYKISISRLSKSGKDTSSRETAPILFSSYWLLRNIKTIKRPNSVGYLFKRINLYILYIFTKTTQYANPIWLLV